MVCFTVIFLDLGIECEIPFLIATRALFRYFGSRRKLDDFKSDLSSCSIDRCWKSVQPAAKSIEYALIFSL